VRWASGASNPSARPEAAFDLGVASFDPLPDRVLLWTRVRGGGRVRWSVARDPAMGDVAASGTVDAAGEPWTVTVDATGLEPGTTYWYRFERGAERSAVGRTRTLPAGDADRLRIGLTCCARYGQSTFAVYRALAAADVDVVVHLGDYVYEDAKGGVAGREPDPDHDAVTLDDYRCRHVQHRRDTDLQRLHAAHPMIVMWDDHDIADNAWSGGAKSHDDRRDGPWAARVSAALAAHQAFAPKRLADPADLRTAWRCFDAGSLLRLVCTETRVAGRDRQAGLDGAAPAGDPDRSLLGDRQRAWLQPLVADPGPAWVILASGTVVSELDVPAPDELDRALPEKYAVVDGCGVNTDQWDGYHAERAGLAAGFARRAAAGRGNVVVSGDIHSSWALEGPRGPAGAPVAVEVVCPPAATTPLGALLPGSLGRRLGPALCRAVDGARWVDAEHHGFVALDVARDRTTATWWWVDPAGDGRPVRGAVWLTLPGEPGRWHVVDEGEVPSGGAFRLYGWRQPLRRVRSGLRRRRVRHRGPGREGHVGHAEVLDDPAPRP
jgi:alkaline phosphatase D